MYRIDRLATVATLKRCGVNWDVKERCVARTTVAEVLVQKQGKKQSGEKGQG